MPKVALEIAPNVVQKSNTNIGVNIEKDVLDEGERIKHSAST